MYTAHFIKKWSYGDPSKVKIENDDWFLWVKFVNMAAEESKPGLLIQSEWGSGPTANSLYGYSMQLLDGDGKPPATFTFGKFYSFNKGTVYNDMQKAPFEDWRIETHQELLAIAVRVIKFFELREERWDLMKATIKDALEENG